MTDSDTAGCCCIVLGMHRSGSSCLARILHAAGLYMGEELPDDRHSSNLFGHWEVAKAVEINDRLLARSGGTWDDPPAQLRADGEIDNDIRSLLRSLERCGHYGWKDPRMTLTLPVWLPHLKNLKLVA